MGSSLRYSAYLFRCDGAGLFKTNFEEEVPTPQSTPGERKKRDAQIVIIRNKDTKEIVDLEVGLHCYFVHLFPSAMQHLVFKQFC